MTDVDLSAARWDVGGNHAMISFKFRYRAAIGVCVAALAVQNGGALAADARSPFYAAALCSPPYSVATATAIYEAAEKLAKPDTSALGAAIYKLPQQIGRDGFQSSEVFIAGMAVGVLIEGAQADKLAAKYQLKRESSNLQGASDKGYARRLAKALQPPPGLAGPGKVSIVAREGAALQGKTLLACEFVPG